MQNFI